MRTNDTAIRLSKASAILLSAIIANVPFSYACAPGMRAVEGTSAGIFQAGSGLGVTFNAAQAFANGVRSGTHDGLPPHTEESEEEGSDLTNNQHARTWRMTT